MVVGMAEKHAHSVDETPARDCQIGLDTVDSQAVVLVSAETVAFLMVPRLGMQLT